ncbi:MAG: protein translocase subunit SecF [Eubacteriales bacterium]|nr:protein translocase subunit SecF [Bacillota bacterium]MBV1727060.1 protein translocase subunit SecF [Desulforudis sp.]MDP3051734.1 protein translocase subunit SecF [Eubacteriales bacterium]MDQ7790338.1 protein translocase subunit SecF [Clostridia bacterium]MBU4533114.1 protein translocase subunit SecF [Bacillota bacterium]
MFHFIRLRRYWYIFSLIILIPGIISLGVRGLNLGIDFTGGNLVELGFEQVVSVPDVRSSLTEINLGRSVIQQADEDQIIIRTGLLSEEEIEALVKHLDEKYGIEEVLRNEKVGPTIGRELAQKAVLAVIAASLLMVAYISWRFEFKQGLAAIAALLHDALLTLGIFSLLYIEINSAFVAAILTILGYSINATIIIFDRVRENLKDAKKGDKLEDVVNTSLWQTLARSINTTLTVMFMLLALYFLGGATLKTFILAMIIGVTSGTYSSVFFASSVWIDLKRRFPGGGTRRRRTADAQV